MCTEISFYILLIAYVLDFNGRLWKIIWRFYFFIRAYNKRRGPGSSVGIATDYGLDGPGSNPGGDEIFRPSRATLGPTQLPVKWVPVLSRG